MPGLETTRLEPCGDRLGAGVQPRIGDLLDVLAFRAFYRLLLARRDERWERDQLEALAAAYPDLPDVPVLVAQSPNSPEAEAFLRDLAPDIVLARCKTLLQERVFSIASRGSKNPWSARCSTR